MATSFAQATRKPTPPHAAPSTFRNLFVTRPTESIAANEVLFWEGDPAEHLFEIVSGCLRLYRLMPDGRRAITGFMFPGEILGVSFRDRYLFSAEAVTHVKLRRYSRAQMENNLSRMPGLSRELLAMACDELSAAQDQMLLLGRKTAKERMKLFRLAWDVLGSEFAGRHMSYEKFYAGPGHVMDLYSYFNCPWDKLKGRVAEAMSGYDAP